MVRSAGIVSTVYVSARKSLSRARSLPSTASSLNSSSIMFRTSMSDRVPTCREMTACHNRTHCCCTSCSDRDSAIVSSWRVLISFSHCKVVACVCLTSTRSVLKRESKGSPELLSWLKCCSEYQNWSTLVTWFSNEASTAERHSDNKCGSTSISGSGWRGMAFSNGPDWHPDELPLSTTACSSPVDVDVCGAFNVCLRVLRAAAL
mmetsp:Transcript_124234/g.215354  ORF Transcript_124234/g.215354 Transcript_124234/m.215354 type:complete len:205 (-) Transcript_124234:153-767(-)